MFNFKKISNRRLKNVKQNEKMAEKCTDRFTEKNNDDDERSRKN